MDEHHKVSKIFVSTFLILILMLQYCNTEEAKPSNNDLDVFSNYISEKLLEKIESTSGWSILERSYSKNEGIQLKLLDMPYLLKKMSDELQNILIKKMKILKSLVTAAEDLVKNHKYDGSLKRGDVKWIDTKEFTNNDPRLIYNSSFQQPVNFTYSSVHMPVDVYDGFPEIQNGLKWSSGLNKVFQENIKKDENLLWQYFGSQFGYMRTYPALKWNNDPRVPDLYDVRKRSWYIHGSSSPKDMIILIDRSGSVHGQTMDIMRVAIKSVLSTLGENDFVNIASFNDSANWISCFDTLVQANKWNKNILSSAVDMVPDGGIANFQVGLEFAFKQFEKFKLLKRPDEGAECHKLIMLFTDGGMQKPNKTLIKFNKNNDVRIFTYSVNAQAVPFSGVKWIACKSKGYFTNIIGVGAVQESIQNYVKVLSRPQALAQKETFRWSNFYYDIMGLGMLTTVTHPVFNISTNNDKQALVGVMGVDTSIAEMVALVPEIPIGPTGYAFFINHNGFVVFHPHLKHVYKYLEGPPDVDLMDVEDLSLDKKNIRRNMINRQKGSSSLKTVVKLSKTYHAAEMLMEYHYMPVGNTTFRLALVSPKSRTHFLKILDFGKPSSIDLKLAEISIIVPTKKMCKTLKLNDSASEILKLYDKIPGNASENCGKDYLARLMWDVLKTSEVYKSWKGYDLNGSDILGLFATSEVGLVRFHPQSLKIDFLSEDPVKSSYFRRSYVADHRIWTFSSSENNQMDEITASRAVKVQYSGKPYTPVVVGVKFNSSFLNSIMTNFKGAEGNTISCNDSDSVVCYIVDDGGVVLSTNEHRWTDSVGYHLEAVNLQLYHFLDNHTYVRKKEYDYQAKCVNVEAKTKTGSASVLSNLLMDVGGVFDVRKVTSSKFWYQISSYLFSLLSLQSWFQVSDGAKVLPVHHHECVRKSYRYMYGSNSFYEDPKPDENEKNCQKWFLVSKIKKTNLIIVVANRCPLSEAENLPFYHKPVEDLNDPNFCRRKLKYRMRPSDCFQHDNREDTTKCDGSTFQLTVFLPLLSFAIIWNT